jgi:hypothetical protein
MVLAPHWLDSVIEQAMQDGADDYAIAEAIAKSERVVAAIANSRASYQPPKPGVYGPATASQSIRIAVCNAITAAH